MMESFSGFLKRTIGTSDGQKGAILAPPSLGTQATLKGLTFQETSSGILATVVTKEGTDVTDLYKSAVATVQTESFVDDLSKVIGSPKLTETEDAFVQRAKEVARALLVKRIGR